ncbi:MAG: sporulation protein YabP [Lachnospiraceae bacterium]|nr:sporulation protein YabP [Lachnospiraceae bacterium]
MEERVASGSHKLIVNNRKGAALTGVTDVIAFDMNEVLLETELGMLMIKGKDLHVNKLNLEKGEVDIDGTIDSLTYSEVSDYSKKGESILGRLFR